MQAESDIGEGREWGVCGCDGAPFLLAARLHEKFDKFKNILLLPGLGHFEINVQKALVKVLWRLAYKDVAKEMGFKSKYAQDFCQNASNTHKTWELLQIMLFGTGDILLKKYIDTVTPSETPSAEHFWAWAQSVPNETYYFLCDMIFNYIVALYYYKDAMRQCDSQKMLVCRAKFARLFFVCNMTCYQELCYRDTLMRQCAPDSVRDFVENLDAVRLKDGHPGQGGDFVLENVNALAKDFCPDGVPKEEDWRVILRTLPHTKVVRIRKCLLAL